MYRTFSLLLIGLALAGHSLAQDQSSQSAEYVTESNILYRQSDDPLVNQMCRLDLYHPQVARGYATIVWFHGGGLTGGKRSIPSGLSDSGLAIATADYRLSPQVKVKECVDDAAAAVAWVFQHIDQFGGDSDKVFVSGHSAGGYLTSMIGLDKRWLAKYGMDADRIAGLIPLSGHAITHFTARRELGIEKSRPLLDDMAPLHHVRPDAPPMLLITGDRELEMLGRYEENAYLWRMMQVVGHRDTTIYELDGFNHGQMARPAMALLQQFVSTRVSD